MIPDHLIEKRDFVVETLIPDFVARSEEGAFGPFVPPTEEQRERLSTALRENPPTGKGHLLYGLGEDGESKEYCALGCLFHREGASDDVLRVAEYRTLAASYPLTEKYGLRYGYLDLIYYPNDILGYRVTPEERAEFVIAAVEEVSRKWEEMQYKNATTEGDI